MTKSTASRVPLTTGFPTRILGSRTMRSFQFISTPTSGGNHSVNNLQRLDCSPCSRHAATMLWMHASTVPPRRPALLEERLDPFLRVVSAHQVVDIDALGLRQVGRERLVEAQPRRPDRPRQGRGAVRKDPRPD